AIGAGSCWTPPAPPRRRCGTWCWAEPSAAEPARAGHVSEPGVVPLEGDRDRLGGAVAVLGDDEVRLAGAGGLLLVVVLAVDEQDEVGVLLDRARLAQVAHHRGLVLALLAAAVQLRDRDDRHLDLLG